jgi:hypothetical protein
MPSDDICITCDRCKKRIKFSVTKAGRTEECPECGAYVDVPDYSADAFDPKKDAERYETQIAEYERQQQIASSQTEQYQRQLDRWEEIVRREEATVEQMAATIQRWNSLADRVERFLQRLGNE